MEQHARTIVDVVLGWFGYGSGYSEHQPEAPEPGQLDLLASVRDDAASPTQERIRDRPPPVAVERLRDMLRRDFLNADQPILPLGAAADDPATSLALIRARSTNRPV